MGRVATLCVVAAVCVPSPAPSQAAGAHVPYDFVGIVADNTSVDPFRISSQLDDMVHQGVGSVRFQIDWSAIQPYKKWKQVPSQDKSLYTDEGGVPTKYPNPDRVIGALAERHITALPIVLNAPKWDRAKPSYKGQIFAHVPKKFGAYTRFLKALVHRYGHGGTFWDEHPEIEPRPLKQIQPWNEPNIRPFWNIKPWDRKFVSLARASYKAIKQTDPSVKVVFAGLSRDAWNALDVLYHAGARGSFDVAAVHPFTKKVSGLVTILKRVRDVMKRNHDGGKKMDVTELTWPSAKGKTSIGQDISVTPKQQAKNLSAAFKLLASKRKSLKLSEVYWFTWLTFDKSHDNHFDYSGVVTLKKHGKIVKKPAHDALGKTALGLEGCKAKSDVADACAP